MKSLFNFPSFQLRQESRPKRTNLPIFLSPRAKSRGRITILFLAAIGFSFNGFSQQTQQDSTKVEKLDEVIVKAVRVNATSPITHSNVTKADLEKRNLGQDIPMLLNFCHRS